MRSRCRHEQARFVQLHVEKHGHLPSAAEVYRWMRSHPERFDDVTRDDVRAALREQWERHPHWRRHPNDTASINPPAFVIKRVDIGLEVHDVLKDRSVAAFYKTSATHQKDAEAYALNLDAQFRDALARQDALETLWAHLRALPSDHLHALTAGLRKGRALTTEAP
ncbi:hypothetical protein [Deinococcus soli (ex Cha et al. 2016)]|uniref:hypothetical protein n=1 Tax=Deinococcus soli (ex Cha et al. 2016) TaxID=1309411 RepID=UPI00166D73E4|nr:hypothetical protein [Deinococcus soli (ex Cha et al. 2016)]GGB69271.1 hypothetical protein GCM10008019_26830 [Deinococcus soli (ex Cha et al. 2016)]